MKRITLSILGLLLSPWALATSSNAQLTYISDIYLIGKTYIDENSKVDLGNGKYQLNVYEKYNRKMDYQYDEEIGYQLTITAFEIDCSSKSITPLYGAYFADVNSQKNQVGSFFDMFNANLESYTQEDLEMIESTEKNLPETMTPSWKPLLKTVCKK